jgi:uncharacterized protein
MTDEHLAAADAAVRAIPPAWPLASSVAVNPYLGQTGHSLAATGALLARVAGVSVTMPREWYRDRIAAGTVTDADLEAALAAADRRLWLPSVTDLKESLTRWAPPRVAVPTIADLAAGASGIDWPAIIAERFGAWASGYFDEGQALWAAARDTTGYAAWRASATHDLTPEIAGLSGFASFVADAPQIAGDALRVSAARLGLSPEAMPTYFHGLLATLGGWAHLARYKLWQAELAGGDDTTLADLLGIRLLWEHRLFDQYEAQIGEAWCAAIAAHAEPVAPDKDQIIDAILQEACEHAAQRELGQTFSSARPFAETELPDLQAAFCIDVRSEVFRRALESVDPRIQTLGFAGFFGLTTSHQRFASDVPEHRLPVLLSAGLTSASGTDKDRSADNEARYRSRAGRAWGRFKLAAVSSFAFVEATGPLYIGKLVGDALGLRSNAFPNDPPPQIEPRLDPNTKAEMAASILRAMSLTTGFAPLVLLIGHGANVVNNPHASALHCGACGGYAGDVNARLLAGLLNDPDVRSRLATVDIDIPPATLFVAGLHDTTTDGVTLYADDHRAPEHSKALAQAGTWLASATVLARGERTLRLPRATGAASVPKRSRDWAETRPEWALAGCNAFIAAPRSRTTGRNLQGRAFLHEYDWQQDDGFGVLELIMTAPVVVASWISLQYYGSTVSPGMFGAGNKLLHNVVGGVGVIEGNGGILRTGLPWQSVHNGAALAHDPLRLTVYIAAPREAMTAVLERHPAVRALFDNRWLHLLALDEFGRMAWRYAGRLEWVAVAPSEHCK